MKELLLKLIPTLLGLLKGDVLKKAVDALLDAIENAVESSDNKIDDAIVLPLCNLIRSTFDIPDNDEPVDSPDTPNEPPARRIMSTFLRYIAGILTSIVAIGKHVIHLRRAGWEKFKKWKRGAYEDGVDKTVKSRDSGRMGKLVRSIFKKRHKRHKTS